MQVRWLLLFLFTSSSLFAQSVYEQRGGDPNGIHKWYMGRQIAKTMNHFGISWLERPERQEEEDAEQLLRNMGLKQGMQVADIGAGSGFYTIRIAQRIGRGTVYAVDIEPAMLSFIQKRVARQKLKNVKPIRCDTVQIPLPEESIDVILIVDVYHEMSHPREMLSSMYRMLKSSGRIFLVEFRAEDPNVPIKAVHKMTESQAIREFAASSFILDRSIENLPWQHCMVFRKK
ncbi:MAG: class I SAM-dependent methyltransferase [Bacteroidetes bacterium]|nr:class I SAM-dependent methyltransferase [Bacteroidota bacterium]